jgi:hypothetical protein
MSTNNSYAQAGSWFPNVVGNPHLSSHGAYHGTNQWFNEAAFAAPDPGTFGNSRRNSLNGPGLSEVNFSMGKSFAIWEQVHFQVRADATNIFNHPSFGLPSASLKVDTAGNVVTGSSTIRGVTVGGRTMQLSGRISF